MKFIKLLIPSFILCNSVIGQVTFIPDPNFEQALINLGYDSGMPDGSLPTSHIDTITMLEIGNKGITDLTGIQDFASLSQLLIYANSLTNLDISHNLSLTVLECSSNFLDSLDIRQNTNLIELYCGFNLLQQLDLTMNTHLENLDISNNQITTIDLSQNVAIQAISTSDNPISTLDISNSPNLWFIGCTYNLLTELDVSQNTMLTTLECAHNQITHLNLQANELLSQVNCSSNQLTCLNISNGNNANLYSLDASNNQDLFCIQVDDPSWSHVNVTSIDAQTSFSLNCNNNCITGIQENVTPNIQLFPNPTQGNIYISVKSPFDIPNISLEIRNSFGQLTYSSDGSLKNLRISGEPGIYFVKLSTKSESRTFKILKQ